jgi:hypothetical protein
MSLPQTIIGLLIIWTTFFISTLYLGVPGWFLTIALVYVANYFLDNKILGHP